MRNRIFISILVVGAVVLMVSGCERREASAARPTQPAPAPARVKVPQIPEGPLSIRRPVKQADEFTDLVPPTRPPQQITLVCKLSQWPPTIDGIADEAMWNSIQPVTTLDASSQRPIQLKAYHDGQSIFILATYPDGAPSESHKSWIWDGTEGVYKPNNDREDMIVFKWQMTGSQLSFSPELVEPHTADIWFWKACRTNPAGYLDDKHHEVTTQQAEDAVALPSDQYGTLYLRRIADAGKSAYEEKMFFEFQGSFVQKYYPRTPQGSRADVRGKGLWKDGQWTIEVQRALDTGNEDDIRLQPGQSYPFGVCLYEMAGTGVESEWFQPLYRTGNTFDRLVLKIQ